MEQIFKKGQQISVGNFIVSIGAFDTSDVAIISKSTGDFVRMKQVRKTSIRLKRVKRILKHWISDRSKDNGVFCMRFMTPDLTVKLIEVLKGKIKS